MLDELQKQLNRIVGSTLNASLEPLGHWWNKPANFFSLGITLLNCHLNRLNRIHFLILVGGPLFYSHRLSVTIARCYKDVYVSSFFPYTARLSNSLLTECFLLTYDSIEFLTPIFLFLGPRFQGKRVLWNCFGQQARRAVCQYFRRLVISFSQKRFIGSVWTFTWS